MIAPDATLVDELLLNLYTSYQSINLAAISLQQTQIYPLNPAPDWMTTLNTNLASAQDIANDWLVNKGPQVIAQIPQSFISYSNSIQVTSGNLANAATATDAANRLIWLQRHIDKVPAQIETLQQTINTVAANLKPYKDTIEKTLTSVQSTITSDAATVAQITSQISSLYSDISGETVTASGGMSGVISSGASLSVALLTYAYVAATTLSPALPIIGIVVALGGLTYGAITNAINEQKIVGQLGQIRDLQVTLSQDDQVIVILGNIQTMLQNVDLALTGINTAVDMSSIWTDESDKLADLISNLQSYTGTNYKTIPDIQNLPQAVTAWGTIATAASNIQKSAAGITTGGTISISTPSTISTPSK